MGVSVLLFLSLCGGIFGIKGEDICDDGLRRTCVPDEYPFEFPTTAEEMDHLCPILLDHVICIQNFMEKCGDDISFDANNLKSFTAYLRDVCDKDSSIRDDVVTNLPCIKETANDLDESCSNLTQKAMRAYEEHAKVHDINFDDSSYSDQQYCLLVTYELACFVADIDRKCGAVAKDIVLDAQRRTGYLKSPCEAGDNTELIQLAQILELEMEQQVLIKEIILLNENA